MEGFESHDNKDKPRYELPAEVTAWAKSMALKLEDREDYEKWIALNEEVQNKIKESPEHKLAWMRQRNETEEGQYVELEAKLLYKQQKEEEARLDTQESEYPKNILTNLDDVLRAMGRLEGEGWLRDEMGNKEDLQDNYSVLAALRGIEEEKTRATSTDLNRKISTVYGEGGLHRYFVYSDGTIKFSAGHSTQGAAKRAERMGFEIIPR